MSLIAEFWDFMRVRKKFLLAPIIVALVILSSAVIFVEAHAVFSWLIYPLF
jgi:hypothetical protein